jgi:hypothetical protein
VDGVAAGGAGLGAAPSTGVGTASDIGVMLLG